MDQWIQSLLERFGALGVSVLMLIENIFPPIPSEIVMPWAGYAVSQGQTSFPAVIIAGSLGSFAGAMFWYYAARWIGNDRLARWIDRHGTWLTLSRSDLDRVNAWFERWGAVAVLACRLMPGLRTLISVPAGFSEMSERKFWLFTAIGTVAWTTLLAVIGWWLGENYTKLAGPLGWVSTAVVAGLFAWWLVRVIHQQFLERSAGERSS